MLNKFSKQKVKRGPKLKPTEELCDRHAVATGEMIACFLQLAYMIPPWWQWTISLRLAYIMQHAILPRDKRAYPDP